MIWFVIAGSILVYLVSGFVAGRVASANSLAWSREQDRKNAENLAVASFVGWFVFNPVYWLLRGIQFTINGIYEGSRRCIPELHQKDIEQKLAAAEQRRAKTEAEIARLEAQILGRSGCREGTSE